MKYNNYSHIYPYELHLITGPMKSGKSRELYRLLDTFSYLTDVCVLALKPNIDTRDISTRFNNKLIGIEFEKVDSKMPNIDEIYFKNKFYDILIIDECQFFSDLIVTEIDKLLKKGVFIICSGLDLDFRGEVFGPMGELLARANQVSKLTGVCDFYNCNQKATRTQREINGKPAHYDSPIILVGDNEEGYSCRCLQHHIVPNDSLDKYIQ